MTNRRRVALEDALSEDKRELLRELIDALQTIRYGSVLVTVHDGQIVEIQKTEKIRTKSGPALIPQKPPMSPTGGA
jgi:hypothetical protein